MLTISGTIITADGRTLTTAQYKIAIAAGQDAANRQMRAAGRTAWNHDDWYKAAEVASHIMDELAQ